MKTLTQAILVLLVTATALSAQSGRDSWENLKQLKAGHKIKVVDVDLKAWDGRLVSVSDEAITIREKQKQREITVERTKVLRVTDLERSRRGRNALVGLAVGAAIGLAFSADDDWDLSSTGKLIVTSWLAGTGAGVGALFGGHPTIYRSKAGGNDRSWRSPPWE